MDQVLDEKRKQLHPLPKILALNRKELLDDAKLRVPFWKRLTVFRGLFYFFRNLFRGIKKTLNKSRERKGPREALLQHPEAGTDSAATPSPAAAPSSPRPAEAVGSTTLRPISSKQLAAYRNAVHNLKLEFVGSEKTIPQSLKELMEKWNPLYDPQARTNLVEDVNAMVRDYLRNIRRTSRGSPPDAGRIRSLADKLSANKSFDRIKRKDYFTQYIEVYMIKLLGER
jgi:hypothetical protein